jgi:hypothetical protein
MEEIEKKMKQKHMKEITYRQWWWWWRGGGDRNENCVAWIHRKFSFTTLSNKNSVLNTAGIVRVKSVDYTC